MSVVAHLFMTAGQVVRDRCHNRWKRWRRRLAFRGAASHLLWRGRRSPPVRPVNGFTSRIIPPFKEVSTCEPP
jgi:hypothetical protein